jgi:hypothetical protein
MQGELQSAQTRPGQARACAVFLELLRHDQSGAVAVGAKQLISSTEIRRGTADVAMRIGAPALHNFHLQNRASACTSGALPVEDSRNGIAARKFRSSLRVKTCQG